ncbi:MAG: FIST N-terminal domain-containing protein [Myxococcota bacterium]
MASEESVGVALSSDRDARRAGLLAAAEAAARPGRDKVKAVLVFASGGHAPKAADIARGAAEHLPEATVVVIGGNGVVTSEEEADEGAAVSALALPFPLTVAPVAQLRHEEEAEAAGKEVAATLLHRPMRPLLFFARPSALSELLLATLSQELPETPVAGGGLAADGALAVVTPDAGLVEVAAVGIRIDGGLRMLVGASPGVELLNDWSTVDAVDKGFVRRLGGRPPLERLSVAVSSRNDRPLVLAAIRSRGDEQGSWMVRAISGVEPSSGSIHIGSAVKAGDQLCFATLSPDDARDHFELTLRRMHRDLRGGVPVAAVFIDCAGRGARLYGRKGVDVRAVRRRFDGLCFAGVRSSFEVAPFDGEPKSQMYTAVLALIYAPS